MRIQKIVAFALTFVMAVSLLPAGISLAAASGPTQINLVSRGTSNFNVAASATQEVLGNVPNATIGNFGNIYERDIPRGAGRLAAQTLNSPAPLTVPVVAPFNVSTKTVPNLTGFNGISHLQQRLANGGNQFSIEPPDQGLCAGGGYILEAINLALAVYDTHGNTLKGVTDLNTFFGYADAINRTTGELGPFTSDPKCLYDAAAHRWFLSLLVIDQDTAGNFTGTTHTDIAVSQTGDPTKVWNLYRLDGTDGNGTLPGHPGCPCFGDQPLIGFNQDAFIVSTNEFSVLGPNFNGAQIYAIPKLALELGLSTFAIHFDNLSLAEGIAYSVQPSFPNAAYVFTPQSNGTEYFLSALEFTGGLDNRIAVWALTDTGSLYSKHPNLSLNYKVLKSETYGFPPTADQKVGTYPLGQGLGNPENQLNTNDDRMNQVELANGKLYSGLNTVVSVGGAIKSGIAYFVVDPSVKGNQPSGKVVDQGYVALANNNAFFPSIAVADDGRPLMTFSVSGADYFPSAAFTALGSHTLTLVAQGAEAADGFSGYPQFNAPEPGVERWGDYSAAVTDGKTVWMATEFIPGGTRTVNANWGTFVFGVRSH